MRWLLLLLFCIPAFADPRGMELLSDGQENIEIVAPEEVLPGEAELAPYERMMVIHSRPVWYKADNGVRKGVKTDVETGIEELKQVWRSDENTVKFRVTEDGVCVYKVDGHKLRVRPQRSGSETVDGTSISSEDQAKPTETDVQRDRIAQKGSFSGVRFEHIIEPGSVKEIAWLESAPANIETARKFVLGYNWNSDTLTPLLINEEIRWRTDQKKTILTWPAPIVTDAKGKELRANYRIVDASPNTVSIVINALDLRTATYPVAIDPTTTSSQGDAVYNRSSRDSSPGYYKGAYLKVTLPSRSGDTVTDATIQYNASTNAGPMNNISVYAIASATAGAWDESSTYTTLDALSMGTAVSTGNTLSASTGNKTLSIYGDSGKGVYKFYTDNPTGGSITVALIWTGFAGVGGVLNSATTNLTLGDADSGSPYAVFYNRSDATNYPRITITYTAGGGGPTPSFTIGSLIPFVEGN